MSGAPKFSLVIPCYNESASLPRLIERCRECFFASDVEVVLVDNGSTDDSASVLKRLLTDGEAVRGVRVAKNQGYGFGILSGLSKARGEILGWTHADLQTDPADFNRAAEKFRAAATPETLFVKGRRRGRALADEFFTAGMTLFETALLGAPLIDINAQPTVFHRRFFESWASAPHDFSLDLYAYFTAKQRRLDIARFDVAFGERAHGQSHWNVDWKSKVKFIRRTVDYSFELKRRLPGERTGMEGAG